MCIYFTVAANLNGKVPPTAPILAVSNLVEMLRAGEQPIKVVAQKNCLPLELLRVALRAEEGAVTLPDVVCEPPQSGDTIVLMRSNLQRLELMTWTWSE